MLKSNNTLRKFKNNLCKILSLVIKFFLLISIMLEMINFLFDNLCNTKNISDSKKKNNIPFENLLKKRKSKHLKEKTEI